MENMKIMGFVVYFYIKLNILIFNWPNPWLVCWSVGQGRVEISWVANLFYQSTLAILSMRGIKYTLKLLESRRNFDQLQNYIRTEPLHSRAVVTFELEGVEVFAMAFHLQMVSFNLERQGKIPNLLLKEP